jgi:riboflavin synthase
MFTGIIQRLGRIHKIDETQDARTFWIEPQNDADFSQQLHIGDSLATNGVCLTVESNQNSKLQVTAIRQTLSITNLGLLEVGNLVNLETAATINTALGGHMVAGHVDQMAIVKSIHPQGVGQEIWLDIPLEFMKYLILKGSVTLDGVSLTIADISENAIKIALIPETLEKTILSTWKIGQKVNFEVDPIGKYIENYLSRAGLIK